MEFAIFFGLGGALLLIGLSTWRPPREPLPAARRRIAPTVSVRDMPALVEALESSGSEGSFVVVMFSVTGEPANEDFVNLQYSIEGGLPGLDWVLLAPVNVESKAAVVDFLQESGRPVEERVMNGVHYLRTIGPDLGPLGQELLAAVFGTGLDQSIELVLEEVEWRFPRPPH